MNWGSDPTLSGAPSCSVCPEYTLILSVLCTENCLCISFLQMHSQVGLLAVKHQTFDIQPVVRQLLMVA